MGYGTVNTGYPVRVNLPNGVAGLDGNGLIPEWLLPGMGFVEMEDSIPTEERKKNTLYGHILVDFGGDSE